MIQVNLFDPIITSYPDIANHLAMSEYYLYSKYKDNYLNWFMVQYINLELYKNWEIAPVSLIFENLFNSNIIYKSDILQKDFYNMKELYFSERSFSSFLYDNLKEGKVIHTYLDAIYFYDEPKSYVHETLFRGYDKNSNMFLTSDFYNGKYSNKWVSQRDIDYGFKSYIENYYDNMLLSRQHNILSCRCYTELECKLLLNFEFDKNRLLYALVHWQQGGTNQKKVWGKLCYYEVLDMLTDENLDKLDLRILHVFYDRSVALERSIKHVQSITKTSNDILEDARKFVNINWRLRMNYIKYLYVKNKDKKNKEIDVVYKEKIQSGLRTAVLFDEYLISRLIDIISEY